MKYMTTSATFEATRQVWSSAHRLLRKSCKNKLYIREDRGSDRGREADMPRRSQVIYIPLTFPARPEMEGDWTLESA